MIKINSQYTEHLATSRLWASVLNIKDTEGSPFDFAIELVHPTKAALTLALMSSYGEADEAYVDSHIAASGVCLIGGSWTSGLESDRLVWSNDPSVKESASIWVQILNYKLGTLTLPNFGIYNNGTNEECGLATALIAIDAVDNWKASLEISKEVLTGSPESIDAVIINNAINGNRESIAKDIETLSNTVDIVVRNKHLNSTKDDIDAIISKLKRLL